MMFLKISYSEWETGIRPNIHSWNKAENYHDWNKAENTKLE